MSTQNTQGGIARWVKASERMPTKEGRTCVKRLNELIIADATLFKNNQMVFTTPNGMVWNGWKDFEWLDESPLPASPEGTEKELLEAAEMIEALSISEHKLRQDVSKWMDCYERVREHNINLYAELTAKDNEIKPLQSQLAEAREALDRFKQSLKDNEGMEYE